jgi:hypothetical protein
LVDRLSQECRALIEEAHSMGLNPIQSEELDSYSVRFHSIQKLIEEKRVSEAHDNAQILKSDLLGFLDRQKNR